MPPFLSGFRADRGPFRAFPHGVTVAKSTGTRPGSIRAYFGPFPRSSDRRPVVVIGGPSWASFRDVSGVVPVVAVSLSNMAYLGPFYGAYRVRAYLCTFGPFDPVLRRFFASSVVAVMDRARGPVMDPGRRSWCDRAGVVPETVTGPDENSPPGRAICKPVPV